MAAVDLPAFHGSRSRHCHLLPVVCGPHLTGVRAGGIFRLGRLIAAILLILVVDRMVKVSLRTLAMEVP